MLNTKNNEIACFDLLRDFINPNQLAAILGSFKGEEGQFFIDKMIEVTNLINAMPSVIDEEKEDKYYLHYFIGNMDWFIAEKDSILKQNQAFGYADLGMGFGELGYISIQELIDNNIELDFLFEPRSLAEVKNYR